MTNGELLDLLLINAIEYCPDAGRSIIRNSHMNSCNNRTKVDQSTVDALIVDFINFVATGMGGDLGLYTRYLYERRK